MTSVVHASHLWDWLLENVVSRPSAIAYWGWRGGQWQKRTWREIASGVAHAVVRLERLGIEPGDRVATWAANGPQWPLVDLAIQGLGAIHVPIPALAAPAQVAYVLEHSGSKLLVSDEALPAVERMARPHGMVRRESIDEGWGWDETSLHHAESLLRERRERLSDPEQITTLLYTSGTTGEPKGVALSQRNLVSNAVAKLQVLPLGPEDVRLGILPLAHIFGRTCDLYTGLAVGCTHVVGRGKNFWFDDLRQFQPTYLNAVPYFYERCLREASGDLDVPPKDSLRKILGGRIRLCNCGGAPLPDAVQDAFDREEILLITGYGLTETSPVLTSNAPGARRRGTVGRALPGVELKVSDDGEVLAQGPGVMLGYYRDPVATATVLQEGWFHTGDLGQIDSDGYLTLSGRSKELLITRGGRKIVPGHIESRLMSLPWIDQVMVIGDGRNHVSALIVPNVLRLRGICPSIESRLSHESVLIAGHLDLPWMSLRQDLDRAQSDLARWEQVGRWALLSKPFSVEEGTLTPKGSLRRHEIVRLRADVIGRLYDE